MTSVRKRNHLKPQDLEIYNFVELQQRKLNRSITSKEICKEFEISDRSLRIVIDVLQVWHRGVAGKKRIIEHFIGETGSGFNVGTTQREDNYLMELSANNFRSKKQTLENREINIRENKVWGVQ